MTSAAFAQQTIPYVCSFEAPAFTAGSAPGSGWSVNSATSVTVQNAVAYEGSQALRLDAGGQADQTFAQTGGVVWVDAYYRGTPYDDVPDVAELTSGSAVVAFTTAAGITCHDGDGAGGGTWSNSNIPIESDLWYRVTLRLDFSASTYDVYVNGCRKLTGLGFLYDATTAFQGFRSASGASSSYLEYLRVMTTEPAGLVSDGSADDIIAFLLGQTSDPEGLDANNDGMVDLADVARRVYDAGL